MRVWDNIKKWGRGLMERAATATGVAREYKDVFELAGVPAYQQFYEFGIFVWKWLYRGFYRPWHVVPAPTAADANARRELYRLNTPKAVTAEMASLVWGEECEIDVTMDGRREQPADGQAPEPDPLNEFIHWVLRENAFGEKMQECIEQGLALGGAAMKVWRDARRDENGNEVEGSERIKIGYAMADQFVPISWDNARVYDALFISRRAKKGYYYTRLEWHLWNGATYTVRNELYRSEMQKGANPTESQDILGIRCPLAEMYPELDEETVIPVGESLFCYWRTPIANNLDDNSPLGMSVYGNALETLHALDICYDSFVREFRLGKKRIMVPYRYLRTVVDPITGAQRRYFDPNDETYEGTADDNETGGIKDISVELRVEEHVAALNAFLSILCLQLGFSANTFSFDERGGIKTATEVVSENSKTFKTIKTIQNQLEPAIEHLVRNIIDVATLYDMEWQGQKIAALAAGGYHINVVFDDGVTQDRQTNINEGVMLVGAGLLSKYKFLTDRKFGQGLTPEEALEELERIRQEGTANVDAMLRMNTAE